MSKVLFFLIVFFSMYSFFMLPMKRSAGISGNSAIAQYIQKDNVTGLRNHCSTNNLDVLSLNIIYDQSMYIPVLHYAAACGSINVVQYFIASNAVEKKKEILNAYDEYDHPPMHYALNNKKVGMFSLLYKNGANYEVGKKAVRSVLSPLYEKRIQYLLQDKPKWPLIGPLAEDYYYDRKDNERINEWIKENEKFVVYSDIRKLSDKPTQLNSLKLVSLPSEPNLTGENTDCIDTPLHVLAFMFEVDPNRYIIIAEKCFEKKANPNAINEYGNTPLHIAINCLDLVSPNYTFVELLLKNGADLTIKNFDGKTPLECAVLIDLSRLTEIINSSRIKPLDYSGPEINKNYVLDSKKLSAQLFKIIISGNHTDLLGFLQKHKQVEKFINLQDDQGNTPLHYATTQQNMPMCALFLKNGVNPDIKNKLNYSPVNYCEGILRQKQFAFLVECKDQGWPAGLVYSYFCEPYLGEIKNLLSSELVVFYQLLKHRREVSKAMNPNSHIPIDTPLHVAVAEAAKFLTHSEYYCNTIKALLDNNAQVNAINEYGNTPLHLAYAFFFSHEKLDETQFAFAMNIIQLLIEKNAAINAKNFEGKIPLDFVSEQYKEKILNYALEKKQKSEQKITINTNQQDLGRDNNDGVEKVIKDSKKNNDVLSGRYSWENFVKIIKNSRVIITTGLGIAVVGYLFVNYYKNIQSLRFL